MPVAEPADMEMAPPACVLESPTTNEMAPEVPVEADPVTTDKAPDVPDAADPVPILKKPGVNKHKRTHKQAIVVQQTQLQKKSTWYVPLEVELDFV